MSDDIEVVISDIQLEFEKIEENEMINNLKKIDRTFNMAFVECKEMKLNFVPCIKLEIEDIEKKIKNNKIKNTEINELLNRINRKLFIFRNETFSNRISNSLTFIIPIIVIIMVISFFNFFLSLLITSIFIIKN